MRESEGLILSVDNSRGDGMPRDFHGTNPAEAVDIRCA